MNDMPYPAKSIILSPCHTKLSPEYVFEEFELGILLVIVMKHGILKTRVIMKNFEKKL